MAYTTQDRKFLRALHIADDSPSLPSAYPKPEKFSPVASSFIGGDGELIVPMSTVEELCEAHRSVELRLEVAERIIAAEKAQMAVLERKLFECERELAKKNVANANLRIKFATAFGVAVILAGMLVYTMGQLAGGR